MLAARIERLKPSAIGAVLRLADTPDVIALAAGVPARETFCPAEVAEITARLAVDEPDLLQYGDTEGLRGLREWIAQRVGRTGGRPTDAAQVVITHGSQQAIDLICRATLDPGDVVIVDEPSYVGALQVLDLYQVTVTALPLAEDRGLDRLERALSGGLRVKLLYLVTNYANPTGLTMSETQRDKLAELAEHFGFLVIEDDPYGDLCYEPRLRTPLSIAARSDLVVRLGSFSKVLFPAARIGYMTAPGALAGVLQRLKQAADLGNSQFTQRVVHELVSQPGFVDRQIHRACAVYRARRDSLVTSLRAWFGDELEFIVPHGGFFVWARFTREVNTTDLLAKALVEGVSFVPGDAFYAGDPDVSCMRLSFSSASTEDMPEAARRLERAWRTLISDLPKATSVSSASGHARLA